MSSKRYQCKSSTNFLHGGSNPTNITSVMTTIIQIYDTFDNTLIPTPEGIDPIDYCRELNAKAHDRALYLKQINSYTKNGMDK